MQKPSPLEGSLANKSQTGEYYVDSSIASLSGSSQLLLAEQPSRGALLIMNIGNANIGIAFAAPQATATAAIGSSGTFTLAPGVSFEPDGGVIPLNAVYVIGTAGQPVTCVYSN